MAKGTSLAGAMADTSHLTPFEGEPVLGAAIEIPKASGGLNEALKIAPQEFHAGDRLFLVMEVEVEKFKHEPVTNDGTRLGWRRVHILSPITATFVDGKLVEDVIVKQRDAIEAAKDEAAGRQKIPFDGDDAQGGDKAGDDGEPPAGDVNELGTRRKAKAATAKKAAAPKADAEPKGGE